jgi:hypothetical protein
VSGEEARKVFFGSKDLDPQKGYSILFGGVGQDSQHDHNVDAHELTAQSPKIEDLKLEREYENGDMVWIETIFLLQ